eukprot:scaffold752_cov322-Pavlova_lutheri.AAC.34
MANRRSKTSIRTRVRAPVRLLLPRPDEDSRMPRIFGANPNAPLRGMGHASDVWGRTGGEKSRIHERSLFDRGASKKPMAWRILY